MAVRLGWRRGVVAEFDHDRGWGSIRSELDPSAWFHCTAIASGSRAIDEGAAVTYRMRPARLGRWEAVEVTTVGGDGGSGTSDADAQADADANAKRRWPRRSARPTARRPIA